MKVIEVDLGNSVIGVSPVNSLVKSVAIEISNVTFVVDNKSAANLAKDIFDVLEGNKTS